MSKKIHRCGWNLRGDRASLTSSPSSFVLCAPIPHVPSNTSLETGKAFTEFGTLSPSCPLQRGLWSPSTDGRACGQSNLRHVAIWQSAICKDGGKTRKELKKQMLGQVQTQALLNIRWAAIIYTGPWLSRHPLAIRGQNDLNTHVLFKKKSRCNHTWGVGHEMEKLNDSPQKPAASPAPAGAL